MNPNSLKDLKISRYLPGPEAINIYKISGTFTTVTPLHVGSGEFGPPPDRKPTDDEEQKEKNCAYIEKDYQGRPIIPGSSLKGVLRNWLEVNLMPFNMPGQYNVTSLSNAEFEIQQGITSDEIENKKRKLREEAIIKKYDSLHEQVEYVIQGMTIYYLEKLDLVAGLFGFGRFKSRLEIDTACLKDPAQWNMDRIFTMPGVAIDRETGTAKEHSLFTYELVPPDIAFQAGLTLKNVRYWEIGMVFSALEGFNHSYFPIRVGGMTNNGYGQIKWKIEKIYQMGDDDREKAAQKIRQDLKAVSFDPQGNQHWENLTIERRGLGNIGNINAFKNHCIWEFKKVLNNLIQ